MKGNLKWRFILIAMVTIVSVAYVIPSIFGSKLPYWWKKPLPSEKVHLGLDLQGGMHLVLGVKLDKAVENSLEATVTSLKDGMRKEGVVYDEVRRIDDKSVELKVVREDFAEQVDEVLKDYYNFHITFPYQGDNTKFLLTLRNEEIDRIRRSAIDQAKKTISDRIDQFGVTEPTIAKQGDDRILIQLPGIRDTERAIALIGKTAQLEFRLVDDEHNVDQALQGELPEGTEVLYERSRDKVTGRLVKKPYLLKKATMMAGDVLTDARVQPGEYGVPYVSMTFNKAGGKLFGQITGENVGKRLAIVLDDNVYSAPVIREKITGGRAQITGSFTDEEARDLAIVLRAGALPAPVEILEQRTVGPSLGKDSIHRGFKALLVGTALVLIFMVMYYKLSGLIADFGLFINLLTLMAFLAAVKATLTLPGVAGIILTVGMAVDNNVLVFERIREELDLGKTIKAAITGGFDKAYITIIDSSATTLIAALILYQFGTGPIKGFAVTLSVGLVGSVFTAVIVSRFIYDWFLSKRNIAKLSI
ncbi:MAG: protein translocase subunit SecD [bacterium]